MCTYFLRFIPTVAEKDTAGSARPRMGRGLAAATSIEERCGKPAIIYIDSSISSFHQWNVVSTFMPIDNTSKYIVKLE